MTLTPESEPSRVAAPTEGDAFDDLVAEVEEAIDPLGDTIDWTPLDHQHRMLLVHAHPDDEVIGTGGTMAKYAAANALVTLVTCTLGEEGEVVVDELKHLAADQDDQLGPAPHQRARGRLRGARRHRPPLPRRPRPLA